MNAGPTSQSRKQGLEMRRHPRFTVEAHVRIRLANPPVSMRHIRELSAVTRNVSRGGLFMELEADGRLPEGAIGAFALFRSQLELTLELGHAIPRLNLNAKAVWVEKREPGKPFRNGVAVAFDSLTEEQSKSLDNFIRTLGGQPPM